jgi:Na+/citrate or Na+/malate symporter
MSLRAFHLLFIALSIVLAAFLAAWAVGQYRIGHDVAYLGACAASLGTAGGLAVYAVAFQRKTRNM